MFDALDDARTDVPGKASFQLLLQLVGDFAGGSGAFVAENAFRAADGLALRKLLAGADALHIHCDATHGTRRARTRQRAVAGERHPSHADPTSLSASEIYAAPNVRGDPLTVPTTSAPRNTVPPRNPTVERRPLAGPNVFGSAQSRAAVAEAVARAAEPTRCE